MATPPEFCSHSPFSQNECDGQSYNCATPLVDGLGTQYSDILDVPTPGVVGSSQGYDHWSRSISVVSYDQQPPVLGFIPLRLWNKDEVHNEMPVAYVHYDIDWKVKIGRKVIFKETEENIVVDPASFWRVVLQPRLEEQLQKHVSGPPTVSPRSTDVTVSVTGREERPLNKQFEGASTDWSVVERKLLQWSDLFRNGKRLRVDICSHYTEGEASVGNTNDRNKRRKKLMLKNSRQDTHLHGGTFTKSCGARVRHVQKSLYCFYDRKIGRRRKLKSHHLRYFVRYYERGNALETDQDVPEELRSQIEAEEKRLSETKRSQSVTAAANVPHIQIVMPRHGSPDPEARRPTVAARRIDLSGLHDVNLQQYCDWLQSRVQGDTQKADYQKATDFLIDHGFDLDLLYEDPDPAFLINEGKIKVGNARRYMKDVPFYIDARLMEAS